MGGPRASAVAARRRGGGRHDDAACPFFHWGKRPWWRTTAPSTGRHGGSCTASPVGDASDCRGREPAARRGSREGPPQKHGHPPALSPSYRGSRRGAPSRPRRDPEWAHAVAQRQRWRRRLCHRRTRRRSPRCDRVLGAPARTRRRAPPWRRESRSGDVDGHHPPQRGGRRGQQQHPNARSGRGGLTRANVGTAVVAQRHIRRLLVCTRLPGLAECRPPRTTPPLPRAPVPRRHACWAARSGRARRPPRGRAGRDDQRSCSAQCCCPVTFNGGSCVSARPEA